MTTTRFSVGAPLCESCVAEYYWEVMAAVAANKGTKVTSKFSDWFCGSRDRVEFLLFLFRYLRAGRYLYTMVQMYQSKHSLHTLDLSYSHVGPRDQTQVRLGSKHHLPENLLARPRRESLYSELVVGGVVLRETEVLAWTTLDLHLSSLTFLTRSPWEGDLTLHWFSSFKWRWLLPGLWLTSWVL